MKIAVDVKVLTYNHLGGIGNYTKNVLFGLAKLDRENEYVLCANAPILHKVTAPNFSERILAFPRDKYFAYIGLPFLFGRERFDLLFLPSMAIPLFNRPKTVMVCHDLYADKTSLRKKLFMDFSVNYALSRADHIIADSMSTKNDVLSLSNVKEEDISVIPLAYDVELFAPADASRIAAVKEKYSLKSRYIINVSSLFCYRKNIVNQIRAFKITKEKYGDDLQFFITGRKDNAHSAMLAEIEKLGLKKNVIVEENLAYEDLPALYSGAEALSFASLYEGFGLPALEAMACGCPVISSNNSSLPEVCGNAALYVDPSDVNSIADGMMKVLKDEKQREQLIIKGLKRVKSFSWDITARKTLDVIRKLGVDK